MIERQFIQKSISMLIEVGLNNKKIYETEFETQFLKKTQEFYRDESQRFIAESSCNDYIIKASERFN